MTMAYMQQADAFKLGDFLKYIIPIEAIKKAYDAAVAQNKKNQRKSIMASPAPTQLQQEEKTITEFSWHFDEIAPDIAGLSLNHNIAGKVTILVHSGNAFKIDATAKNPTQEMLQAKQPYTIEKKDKKFFITSGDNEQAKASKLAAFLAWLTKKPTKVPPTTLNLVITIPLRYMYVAAILQKGTFDLNGKTDKGLLRAECKCIVEEEGIINVQNLEETLIANSPQGSITATSITGVIKADAKENITVSDWNFPKSAHTINNLKNKTGIITVEGTPLNTSVTVIAPPNSATLNGNLLKTTIKDTLTFCQGAAVHTLSISTDKGSIVLR